MHEQHETREPDTFSQSYLTDTRVNWNAGMGKWTP